MKSKNLRRLLAVFLCLVMVLSLFTACGKKDDDDDDDDDDEKTSQEDKKTSSTYTTPLDKEMVITYPKNYAECEAARSTRTSGLVDDEINEMVKLLRKVGFMADEEESEENIQDMIAEYTEMYGEDYEFYYEINSKTALDKDALKDAEEETHAEAKETLEEIENTEPEDITESIGLSETGAEKYLKLGKTLYEKIAKFEITEGYELEVAYFVKGSALEEPKELYTDTVSVYKIDNCWVILPIRFL